MKFQSNTIENLIATQLFKISKSDKSICDYLIDTDKDISIKKPLR